ncbi:MAG: hypothetical protein COB37_05350 [Kordiimonadales bacterium]|nr:MAG: hypothetical protein COB37_05350 [Kordiimonadales bacterium]
MLGTVIRLGHFKLRQAFARQSHGGSGVKGHSKLCLFQHRGPSPTVNQYLLRFFGVYIRACIALAAWFLMQKKTPATP